MECMYADIVADWNNSRPHRKDPPQRSAGTDISTVLDRVSLLSYRR